MLIYTIVNTPGHNSIAAYAQNLMETVACIIISKI